MNKAKKLWLGLLAFLPLTVGIGILIYTLTIFFTPEHFHALQTTGDEPPAWLIGDIIGLVILAVFAGLLHLAALIYFIIHAINNPGVKSNERIIWIVLFIFTGSISFPIYWAIRIWPDPKPESNFIRS